MNNNSGIVGCFYKKLMTHAIDYNCVREKESVSLYICVYAFRSASLHGPGHDTPGLHSLRCDHCQRDAALGRGLELALL